MRDVWGTGGVRVGKIVTIHEKDFGNVGYCWMKGRLKDGDLAIAVRHSGDSFWSYMLLEETGTYRGQRAYKVIPESVFGAYVLGTDYAWQPTEREMHLLLAGERVVDVGGPGVQASWLG